MLMLPAEVTATTSTQKKPKAMEWLEFHTTQETQDGNIHSKIHQQF